MFSNNDEPDGSRVSAGAALRHLVVFQLKLAADAMRDLFLSPLSILAFGLDVLRKPTAEKSLYLRLMLIGRRSDRMINLFDDHKDGDEFTIDRAVDELEELLRSRAAGTSTAQETPGSNPQDKA
jgi:hypothetical protein